MSMRLIFCGICSGMMAAAVPTSGVYGADAAASAGSDAGKGTDTAQASVPAPREGNLVERLKAASISPPLREIVQMFDSGINPTVIQAYVESSSIAYQPNGDEIIYLHEHGIPSSIISAMIQRGASLREQTAAAQSEAAAQADAPAPANASTAAPPSPAPSPAEVVSPTYDYSGSPTYVYASPGYSYAAYPSYGCVYSTPYFYSRPYVAFGGHHYFSRPLSHGRGFRHCR
jgi:hypothetical protein